MCVCVCACVHACVYKCISFPYVYRYGWSRARYVYSLISGVGIFFLGAGVSSYHGIMGLIHPHVIANMPVAFSVLGASAVVEGCKYK